MTSRAMPARVLVVDDEPIAAHLHALTLESAGYVARTASSSGDALQLLDVEAFDLVLLDLYLSGAGGGELLEQLRERCTAAQLPIVIVSGDQSGGLRRALLMLGANDFLEKPVAPQTLLETVRRWTAGASFIAAAPTEQSVAGAPLPRNLIVIDDDLTVEAMLRSAAAATGLGIETVTSAALCLRSLDLGAPEQEPAALLIDLFMPDADGFDLMRALSARKCRVPVMLMTGIDANLLAAAREFGRVWGLNIVDTFTKPVPQDRLRARLEALCAPRAAIRTAARDRVVLIVDDDPDILTLLDFTLSEAGFEVLQARDGREALDQIRAHDPIDVLFTDIDMPRMNGVELAFAAEKLRPRLKIVFASGKIATPPMANALFVPKPYLPSELLKVLGEALVN